MLVSSVKVAPLVTKGLKPSVGHGEVVLFVNVMATQKSVTRNLVRIYY